MILQNLLNTMVEILILMVIGFLAARFGLIDKDTNRRLTAFTLVIPQSGMILSGVINAELSLSAGQVLALVGTGFVMYAALFLLGLLAPAVCAAAPKDRGVYRFMTMFGNCGFMGFPIIAAVFGSEYVFYAALANTAFNVLAYSLGISLVCGGGAKSEIRWRNFINAPIIATLVSLLIMALRIQFPAAVCQCVTAVGDSTVPLSMIIIGASLYGQKFREILFSWRVYVFAAIKLLAAPVLVWAVLRLFVREAVTLGICTVLAAMPSAAISTMFAIRYGKDETLASRNVVFTTVLSLATVPLIYRLLLL